MESAEYIASSLVDTMGSIVAKIESDLAQPDHYLSVSERRPSASSINDKNLTQSSGMFSDVNKSDESESLKSFEMNELINDISDDSINNENANQNDVAIQTRHDSNQSPDSVMSAEGDNNNDNNNNNECLAVSATAVIDTQSERQDLTKVALCLDGYESDNSGCVSFSEPLSSVSGSQQTVVISTLLEELVSEVSAYDNNKKGVRFDPLSSIVSQEW